MTVGNSHLSLDSLFGRQHIELELLAEGQPSRSDVERFIQLVFKRSCNAHISHFLPYLLSMREEGRLTAALGLRQAKKASLFLEAYLDRPVENALAARIGRPIDRSRLVEVGNLAAGHGGGARALIITLTAYLKGAGYEWVVFTATRRVRNNFANLEITLIELAQADPQRLGPERHDWGSYYDQYPVVVAGNIAEGANNLLCIIDRYFPAAQQLWEQAFNAGRGGRLWQPPRKLAAQWPEWMLKAEGIDPEFKL